VGAVITDVLTLAVRKPLISAVAGRFSLARVVDAYQSLESHVQGKVLVLPG
jgi:hypothetical protein